MSEAPQPLLKRTNVRVSIAAAAAVLLLGGSMVAGIASAKPTPVAATPTATPTPTPTVEPRPTATAAPAATRVRTCSVADLASDPRLQNMQAHVRTVTTDEVLFNRGGDTASRTASVLKVLTAAAALDVLGPDYRATTTVVRGAEPGTIVLVGGGDITLSRTPSGNETVYPNAPHLDDLADQVYASWGDNGSIDRIVLDDSYFSGDTWEPSWNRKELYDGYMPEITALQVDGDRNDPYSNTSVRSEDPVGRAGDAFADYFGGVNIERGVAPEGAEVLASVQSPTVAELIDKAMIVSDNTVAEMLARLVAIETGSGNSFTAINAGVLQGLSAYGIDTTGITVVDGSGLSGNNAVPPAYMTELFRQIDAGAAHLAVIRDALPIAGETGSLSYSDRFSGDSSIADGSVFAKTGWIDDGYTLSGIIHAEDGTHLTFAIYALGDVSSDAKQAIDALTAGFYRCGDNLSNQ